MDPNFCFLIAAVTHWIEKYDPFTFILRNLSYSASVTSIISLHCHTPALETSTSTLSLVSFKIPAKVSFKAVMLLTSQVRVVRLATSFRGGAMSILYTL